MTLYRIRVCVFILLNHCTHTFQWMRRLLKLVFHAIAIGEQFFLSEDRSHSNQLIVIWRCGEKKCGSHLLWVVNSILPIITFHHYLLIVTSITLSVCQVSTEELGRNHVLDQVTNTTLSIWSANSNMSHSIETQAQPGSPFISSLSCNKSNNTFGNHNRANLPLLQFSYLDPILHRNQLLYYPNRILFSNT